MNATPAMTGESGMSATVSGAGSAWAIGSVSEVKIWAEPTSAFYTLSTGRLATWGNTDGDRVALVPDTGTPLWEADSGNGIGGFLFDQARPDTLKTSTTISVTTWCAWVLYKDAAANQTILAELSATINSNNGLLLYTDTTWSLFAKKAAGSSQKNLGANWGSPGTPAFTNVRWEFDGTHAGSDGYKNGTLVTPAAEGSTADPGAVATVDTLYVGGRATGVVPIDGPLQLFVFATPNPSGDDRALITADIETRFY